MSQPPQIIIGIDLSGPANVQDTVLVAFEAVTDRLRRLRTIESATDSMIWRFVSSLSGQTSVTIGLDAPLSYNPGGGDRPGDTELRQVARAAGLAPGSIMPPTLQRMIYLTVRGMAVARGAVLAEGSAPRILEVHPGASLALHGAPIDHVRAFARHPDSRQPLLRWLADRGIEGILHPEPSSHFVAACAAAFAAWRYSQGRSRWCRPSVMPEHPFDYCA